jgi:predicted DNA-binding transcriptional regulator YafY
MNRVDRLMAYLLLFQSRGLMRAQDFARRFEISERTVYRDIQSLCEVGVPIVAMPGEGYRLMEGYYLPPIAFSPDEARALYLAISMLAGLTTPGHTRAAALSALDKIRTVLPAATLRQMEALQAIVRFYAFPGPALDLDDEIFIKLQEAIHQRRVVHLRYHALHSNEVTEREVEPIELVYLDKAWLVSGYCRLRQARRAFRLDRIDGLKILHEQFPPREIATNVSGAKLLWVVVRFNTSIVRWVRERQHFSWSEEETARLSSADSPDHTTMVYCLRSFDQIESWLLSWGDNFELREPAELRERLAGTAARIVAKHQNR